MGRGRSDTGPEFGIRIPPFSSLDEVADEVVRAEGAGFDTAWFPDSQMILHDAWAAMAVAATRTERIGLGPSVTNFETRHVTTTAAAVSTIEALAPGRTVVGVGTGNSALKTIGLRPTRLERMREQIQVLHDLLAGRKVSFGSKKTGVHMTPPRPVPVIMAANGPKALQLAGEIADGVMILTGIAPDLVRRALNYIEVGARAAGRVLADVDVHVGVYVAVADDRLAAARVLKPHCVNLAQLGSSEQLRMAGIEVEVPAVVEGVYPDISHAEDWDLAVDIAGKWITDEMALRFADTFCLVGDADYCVRRIHEVAGLGVRHFFIRDAQTYIPPRNLIELFGREVIPRFR